MRSGDFSVRMTGNHLGIEGKIADTFMKSSPPTSGWRSNWSASARWSAARENPAARQVRARQRLLGRHGGIRQLR